MDDAMAKNLILYATDVHGIEEAYERIFKEAVKNKVKAVVFGGDITPAGFLDMFVQVQRLFLQAYLIPRLRKFREKNKIEVFLMFGNDDFSVNLDLVKKAENEGLIKFTHGRVHELEGFFIVGYACVNPTPFRLKDWERSENQIKKDLNKLKKLSDPKKTIYVFHDPPYGTKLDILYSGEHIGSKSVKEFIEKEQPFLTLHGHIHESPEMSGSWKQRIGKTLSINPGDVRAVIIDLDDLEKSKIIGV